MGLVACYPLSSCGGSERLHLKVDDCGSVRLLDALSAVRDLGLGCGRG